MFSLIDNDTMVTFDRMGLAIRRARWIARHTGRTVKIFHSSDGNSYPVGMVDALSLAYIRL